MSPTVNWQLARAEFSDLLADYVASDDAPEDFSADISFDSILSAESGNMEESLEKGEEIPRHSASYRLLLTRKYRGNDYPSPSVNNNFPHYNPGTPRAAYLRAGVCKKCRVL